MRKLFVLLTMSVICVVSAWALEAQVNDSIYSFTTEPASYPGGDAAMLKQLAEHIELPNGLATDFSGSTAIKAVVEKNGTLSNLQIVKSCGRVDVDSAVLKAATFLSYYSPAKNDGQVVRSYTFIPTSFPIMFRIIPSRAINPASDHRKYLKLLPVRYVIGALQDTVAVTMKYVPADADATHFERTITRGDTTIIQKVSLNTQKVTDEDLRVRGTFRRQNIYDKFGHLSMRVSPYKGGEYVKIKHYLRGEIFREYILGRGDVTEAVFYGPEGETTGRYLYENGHAKRITSPVLGVAPMPASASNTSNVEESGPIFQVVEKMPEFPGGEMALFKFLGENVKYPVIAQENGIQGTTIVSFVVNTDGTIVDVEIEKSAGDASLDKEAMRVVRSMPKWIPGKNHGEVVRVKYSFPINFRLR